MAVEERELKNIEAACNEISNLADEYRTLQKENERLYGALEDVRDHDEGLLGGDEDWSVDQWHDYIRTVIESIQAKANAGLEE